MSYGKHVIIGLLVSNLAALGDVYWTTYQQGTSDGIYRADQNGENITQLIKEEDLTAPDYSYIVGLPMDLAVDAESETIYLIETSLDTIWRTDFAGSTFTEILQIEGEDPHQMEIDWENQHIYWVEDNGPDAPARVGRCDLDGSNPIYLIEDAGSRAGGLALDATHGYLFWTESYTFMENPSLAVWRCDLDGSNPEAIVTDFAEGTFELGSIAADPETNQIYWFQDHLFIRRAGYNGENPETLYEDENIGDRSHLVIDSQSRMLYWTSLEAQMIGRAALDGSSNAPWIQGLSSSPLGIALVPAASPPPEPPEIRPGEVTETAISITWIQPSADWTLESSTQLMPGSWAPVSLEKVILENGNGTATFERTSPHLFFRLHQIQE